MAARAGYTALTPETTTFPPRYIPAPVPPADSEAIQPAAAPNVKTRAHYPTSATTAARTAFQRYWDRFQGFVDNNAGLLLVALAQLFFAFVNVSVKVLKDVDVPMPTLEVRYTSCVLD